MNAAPGFGSALSETPLHAVARRFRRNRPAVFGLLLVGALVLFALLGPVLLPHDPNASDFSLARDRFGAPPGPSASHWLGTDALFRDLLVRLAHGARLSLTVALLATGLATALGAVVGLASGWLSGTRLHFVDVLFMRIVDIVLALPFLLFVTAVGVAVGRADAPTILLVLGLTGWTGTARLIRAKTLQIREQDFVAAARALGARPMRIIVAHLLPNVTSLLLVIATSAVAQMILAEAVLGYLTVGIPPPRASLGRMLYEAEPYLSTRLALMAAPGFVILLAVLGFNRVGEGLRDALDSRGVHAPRASGRLPVDLLIATAALLLVGLATPNRVHPPIGEVREATAPVRGGVLRVATFTNVRTLDPALAYDEAATAIDELLFGRLVTWNAAGEIVPDLATAMTVSADGRTHTFSLRAGVRFHDGAELVAADVKRSLERTLHPRTPSPAASHYAMIVGFEDYHSGKSPHLEGIRVLSEHAIEFRLTEADATFLPLLSLAFAAPVCPSSGTQADSKNPTPPCGTGPFRLASWEPETSIRLTRHEAYYQQGRPYLDGIEWSVNVRPLTQRYKFEDGQLDYLREFSPADVALYRADPAWATRGRWTTKRATNAIFLNTEMPPFERSAMRRAVAFAVDPSVLERVRPDIAAIDRVLPESVPGPDRSKPMRRHDPRAALEEMSRAGYPFDPVTGRGGYPEEIEYLTVSDSFEQRAGEVFQQQLARIGIRIRLKLVTWATYLAEASTRRTAVMGWAGWNADFPDPSNFFEPILMRKAISDDHSQNFAFFANDELDRVLEQAHGERDTSRRFELYERAEAIVRDEAPWVPVYVTRAFEIWQPYVRGYEAHAVISQRFTDVWLDRSSPQPGGSTR